MVINTGILRDVHADEYGFGIADLTVAAMLKAYLQQLKEEAAVEVLSRVVRPDGIDKEELAALIDNARVVAAISADAWQAQERERVLKNTIEYMRDKLLPALSGEKYVGSMPAEMTKFLTDCWLTVG
ncbi:MAG: hypothetical protein J6I76_01205 [Oribacterium sp.]|nr:hypothetical protein [Oribacterium sp.]